MRFIPNLPLDKITPADYNPRKITEGAFDKLKESLLRFGVCKAIICNLDGTIVAGHQRTKAMKAVGITECPAFVLDSVVALHDEINFNLVHNSVEVETTLTRVKGDIPFGYSTVKCKDIEVIKKGACVYLKEICKLLSKYGEYGSVVINESGMVIHNSDYAYCSKMMGKDLVVYKMRDEECEDFIKYMNIDYGSYNFDSLGIKSYVQTFAQPQRNDVRCGEETYDKYVKPMLTKEHRLMDFGSGVCYNAKKLKKEGFQTHCYEPFFKAVGSHNLSISEVVAMIEDVQQDVEKNGLFDIVVLDFVLNSVVNNDFEHWVLVSCNSLCKKDGVFFTGCRSLEWLEKAKTRTDGINASTRDIEFLDENNYSAVFRNGMWTIQKFHSKQQFYDLLKKYFEEVEIIDNSGDQYRAICHKPIELPIEAYEEALNIELNMEYPNNYHHNKHEGCVKAIVDCHKKIQGEKF